MPFFRTLAALLCGLIIASPALAQGAFGRVERTQAELALERAEAEFETLKAARDEARTKCASRDPAACYSLAEYQRTGRGGVQDLAGAAASYKKACDARDGRGCAGLAYMTVHGRGVAANPTESRRLYRKACDLGEVSGCAAWGNMAFTGAGGPKDVHGGTQALTNACNRGYEWACDQMRTLGTFDARDRPMDRLRDIRNQ